MAASPTSLALSKTGHSPLPHSVAPAVAIELKEKIVIKNKTKIVTIEEQHIDGGIGSIISEIIAEENQGMGLNINVNPRHAD